MKKLLFLFCFALSIAKAQTLTPVLTYDFDAGTLAPTIGTSSFTTPGWYSINTYGSPIGNALFCGRDTSRLFTGQAVPPGKSITVEFILKTGYFFGKNRDEWLFTLGNISAHFSFDQLYFATSGGGVSDNMQIKLNGIGRKSWQYYLDGKYHHFAFVYDAVTGRKEIWIDGQCPAGFSKGVPTQTAITTDANQTLRLNTSFKLSGNDGYYDEVAVYTSALSANYIYKAYTEVMNGIKYSGTPAASVPTAASVNGTYNRYDYANGYVLNDTTHAILRGENITSTFLSQLQSYPLPRFKPNHGILPNYDGIGLPYAAGLSQGSTALAVEYNSRGIDTELVVHYNYQHVITYNMRGQAAQLTDTSKYARWAVNWDNSHSYKSSFQTFMNEGLSVQDNPANHYLRNNSGNFISKTGAVLISGRVPSPATPLDSIEARGHESKVSAALYRALLTKAPFEIQENGEKLPIVTDDVAQTIDPACAADFSTSGFSDVRDYIANRQARFISRYRDSILSAFTGLTTPQFQQYILSGIDGTFGSYFEPHWKEMRKTHTQLNGHYYSNIDPYPVLNAWSTISTSRRGWQMFAEGRNTEIYYGDRFCAAWFAAGWDENPVKNFLPGRTLGWLKAMALVGNEYTHTGFFGSDDRTWSTGQTKPPIPATFAWQAVAPSYAQEPLTRYQTIFRRGNVLAGDVPAEYINRVASNYTFWCGDPEKLIVVRKDTTTQEFLITGTIQPNSSYQENAKRSDTATFVLPTGTGNDTITVEVRQQGSTYYLDKRVPTNITISYIDKWHEWKHPDFWSKNFDIEAENVDSSRVAEPLHTYLPAGARRGDYRSFTTCVSYADSATVFDTLRYWVTPRTTTKYWVWLRMRSRNVSQTSTVNLTYCPPTCGSSKTFSIPADTVWRFYRLVSGTKVSFTQSANTAIQLKLKVGNKYAEIDRIVLSVDSTEVFTPEYTGGVVAPIGVVILASGTLNFCTTSSVTLKASALWARSYLWSNGSTSKSITTRVAGTYQVTVTDLHGVTGSASVTTAPVFCPNQCSAPTSLSQGTTTTTTAYLNFIKPKNALGYMIYIRDSATTRTVFQTFNVSTPSVKLKNLIRNSPYYVRVKTACSGGWSEFTTDSLKIRTSN